jgi:hypothetical protein
MKQYKSGNEFLPYHASASHTPPDFRDGWNACFSEAEIRITELQAQLAGAEAEITAIKQGLHRASFDNESLKKDAGRLDWIIENAVVREDDNGFVLTLFVLVCHQDVRLAIDAAIQAEGKA